MFSDGEVNNPSKALASSLIRAEQTRAPRWKCDHDAGSFVFLIEAVNKKRSLVFQIVKIALWTVEIFRIISWES
jgi:hypothetical protein